MARRKIRKKVHKIFAKNEKNEKSEFFKNFNNFYSKTVKKSINFKEFFVAVTRRAGCLILGSKSNTVSEMCASEELATY